MEVAQAHYISGGQMGEKIWFRLFPWRHKNETRSAKIEIEPQLTITREDGWVNLELFLLNLSSSRIWVEEATIVLTDLDSNWQTTVATGQARLAICQNVEPKDALSLSVAGAIYDAAGRPQGPYSCNVLTSVRYRVVDEWCNAQVEMCRVEMAVLTAVALHSAH